MKPKQSKTNRLNILRSILNGSVSVDILRPPKSWFVTLMDGLYEVECGKRLTAQEFEEWKEANVREQDSIITWVEQPGNEPLQEIHNGEMSLDVAVEIATTNRNEEIANEEIANEQNTEDFKEDTESIVKVSTHPLPEEKETNINSTKPKRKKVKRERITSGLLSEYGETWGY